MAIGIESGVVVDRSFNAGGLSKTFADWMIKTQPNHGPNWFIWDDQRAIGTNPYVVFSNQSSPTNNSKAVFIRWLMDSSNERCGFSTYLWWNNTSHAGFGVSDGWYITTQTGTFAYYFRGGDSLISVVTRIGVSISQVRYTKWNGIWDAATSKGLEPETASGVVVSTSGNNLTLQTGQGANLTIGRSYFIIDIISSYKIRYAKVTNIVDDVVTFDNLGALAFSATSYVSPWPHRWLLIGSGSSFINTWNQPQLHYRSAQGTEQSSPGNNCGIVYDYMSNSILSANPDEDGQYGAQFPWICELTNNAPNTTPRILGELQNEIVAAGNGVAALQDRRTLNTVPYISIENGNQIVRCLIDQESP